MRRSIAAGKLLNDMCMLPAVEPKDSILVKHGDAVIDKLNTARLEDQPKAVER